MMVSGGAFAPGVADGRVLEVLAQAGAFLSGGVLVSSHAFNTHANILGVSWGSAAMQTQDIDQASHRQVSVAMRQEGPDVKSLLLESGMGFFEVPALNPKSPSTSFKLRGQEFHVDLLTPCRVPVRMSRSICRISTATHTPCDFWSIYWRTVRSRLSLSAAASWQCADTGTLCPAQAGDIATPP
jgi:hypothetical protein